MPRTARLVVPGIVHHVTQRGNNREVVFYSDSDRVRYLELLADACLDIGVDIHGYCLMPNHVHLLVTPLHEAALSTALQHAHQAYSVFINNSRGRCGHLWQNRFYSTPMSRRHCWLALRYVELNPVRAKLVDQPAAWRWSSAAVHEGKIAPPAFLSLKEWSLEFTSDQWQNWLGVDETSTLFHLLRHQENPGLSPKVGWSA
jgi:putative transposase